MTEAKDPRPSRNEDNLPICDDRCPCFDGKRCKLLGVRPSFFCEPALRSERQVANEAHLAAEAEAKRLLQTIIRIVWAQPDHRIRIFDAEVILAPNDPVLNTWYDYSVGCTVMEVSAALAPPAGGEEKGLGSLGGA